MRANARNIVILGGSYSGVSVAHYILKHMIPTLHKDASYQVILVSTASQAMCRPACPRALISDKMFNEDKLFVTIPKQFEQYPKEIFRFVQGTATELDHAGRTVTLKLSDGSTENLGFHSLIIATGASTPSPLLGFTQDESLLKDSWTAFREALPNAKAIVIAGGGPAGIETAGELGEYLNGRAGWSCSKLEHPKVSITVVTSDSKILPALRPSLAQKAEQLLAKVGVTVIKNARVTQVEPEGAGTSSALTAETKVTLDDGRTFEADLYIPAYGTRPNTSFVSADLLTADRRIETNPSTLRVDKAGPRIYAIGDCASYARPAIHLILAAVPTLGANIKRDLLGTGEDKAFKEDTRETQLVPIGKSKGIGAMMGFAVPSFVVWLIKGRDYWLWTTGGLWSGKQWNKETK